MSLRVGLGASQADLDVQGEIDFDFFDESSSSNIKSRSPKRSSELNTSEFFTSSLARDSDNLFGDDFKNVKIHESDMNLQDSDAGHHFNKPLIRVSRDDASGVVQKTTIETVIPTPYTYKESKCGNLSPLGSRKGKSTSPRRKVKPSKEETDISDDSSISSMSGSESISSVSEDSFELDESDSMTDVSPLASPYNRFSPTLDQQFRSENCSSDVKEINKKEGVKFTENVEECAKCNTIDFRELVNAMNRLQIKQRVVGSSSSAKSQSPVVTHNARYRKNLSFSNEEVRRIDSDNQVLLKKIVSQQNRAKTLPFTAVQVRSASAVNRLKQQRQVEIENLALLKRLETTKPSRNLSRSYLLRDYDRRSSGLLSRSSSRSSYPSTSSQASYRTSGRSSAISIKSASNTGSHSSLKRSHFTSSSSDKL